MHDWTRVPDGIFHAFHHGWISAISDMLNTGLLPPDSYALPEQQAAGFSPDVRFRAQTEAEFYRRKKSSIAVRHVSGDRIVAMVEIVSPGNKSTQHAFRSFVDKACELLEHRIHLLLVDPLPPGPRDPNGIHAAIWAEVEDDSFTLPEDKPLTLVAYECDLTTRAYIEPFAVGEALPDMPLYLMPHGYIKVPLEAAYQTAYGVMPARWRRVLDRPAEPPPKSE
jgi:hypothetical protein